jgi:subtilisin family serine protease
MIDNLPKEVNLNNDRFNSVRIFIRQIASKIKMSNHFLRSFVFVGLIGICILSGCSVANLEPNDNLAPKTSNPLSDPGAASRTIPNSYIIVFKENVKYRGNLANVKAKAIALMKAQGLLESNINFYYSHSILGFAANLSRTIADKIANDSEVEFVEIDQVINSSGLEDGDPVKGKNGTAPVEAIPPGILSIGGFTEFNPKDTTHRAWIIDSGIDNHPDLNINYTLGFSCFQDKLGMPDKLDYQGHGTHVAGIIGALKNKEGIIGVAAGYPVIPVRVLDSTGRGSISTVIAGINHVGDKGIKGDVANISWTCALSRALDNAVSKASQNKGVKFVIAAGNERDDANLYSPGHINGPNIFTIAAHDNVYAKPAFAASFSNYGNPDPIDFIAPGMSIYSTFLVSKGSYAYMSGTSMAAPHVTGLLLVGEKVDTNGTITYQLATYPRAYKHNTSP